MVEGRLQKRLKASDINSFEEYVEWALSDEGRFERLDMIDAISTNKTDFFRESAHFDFMTSNLLPERNERSENNTLKIWSCASSSGEEIYTIAMIIAEYNELEGSNKIDFSILGTDISVEILKKAVAAVYRSERIENIPITLRNKYFLRSRDRAKDTVRITPQLRSKAKFGRLNLMDNHYNVEDKFDIIFCRNVLIYFDKENQEKVINKLCNRLKSGGYFFLGHSESIFGKNVPLKQIKPTIYKKT
jgi:chemotaxis protein methyltransferase CheR